jgi:hypothetical protein
MRAAVPLIWLVCAALLGACDMINDATAPIDRDRLLEDMSKQLQRGAQVRYQAEYQLAGGHRATVGQQTSPLKTSYEYPGGLLIIGEADRTMCDIAVAPARCEIRSKDTRAGAAYTDVIKKGLMTTPVLADLLRIAALQQTSSVKGHDTTVAGLQASCLEILGLTEAAAANFTACVTADGVVASFAGLVNGANVDFALVHLALRAPDADAFTVPADANVVDLRHP